MMADGCSTFIGDLNLRRVTGGVLVFTFSIYQIGLYCVCLPNVKLILDYQIPAPCIKDLKIMGNDKHKTDKLKPMASRRNDRFPAVRSMSEVVNVDVDQKWFDKITSGESPALPGSVAVVQQLCNDILG